MAGYDWNPDTYLAEMLEEIPGYEELQEAVAPQARGTNTLEVGTGTGETALRVLAHNPGARWTGIDASAAMLAAARARLPETADLRVQRLEDPLPEGSFDLVVSVLAVHHLDANAKRDLFTRVCRLTSTFVLGDVVIPEDPDDAAIEIDGVYDVPDTAADQVRWLREAGFTEVDVLDVRPDLAVVTARTR